MAETSKTLVFNLTVDGKLVHLKESLSMKDGHRLPALMKRAGETADLEDQVAVCVLVIDTWELPGDPKDPKAYEDLDVFTEFMPLANQIGEHLQTRFSLFAPTAKNSESASS